MDTAIDILIDKQNTLEGLVDLCYKNNLDINSLLITEAEVNVWPVIEQATIPYFETKNKVVVAKNYTTQVSTMQDLFDLSLQECGSLEGLFAFMNTGNIQNINVAPVGLVICNTDNVFDFNVVKNFNSKRTKIATKTTTIGEGIGYWGIEFDFIVQ